MGRTFARRGGLLPLLVALLAIAPCAFALYPEQVEEYTWLRRRVSPATQIVPLEHDGGGVLVAGSEGTIARLRTADGEVAWRVVLSEGAAVHSLTVGPGIVIATVDEAPQLRVYNVTTGGLLWDADEALPSYPGTPTLAVSRISTGCWIARRTPASAIEFSTCYEGKVASTFTLAGISDAGVVATVHGDPKTPLGVLVTVVKRGTPVVSATSLTISGESSEPQTVQFPTPLDTVSRTPSGHVVALSLDGASACFAPRGAASGSCVALPSESVLQPACDGILPLTTATGAAAVALKEGALEVAADLPGAATSGCASVPNLEAVGFAAASSDERSVLVHALTNGYLNAPMVAELPTELTSVRWDGGAPLSVLAASAAPNLGLVVSLSDGGLAGVRGSSADEAGAVAWARAEGLALVDSADFFDLPAPTAEAEAEAKALEPSTWQRLGLEASRALAAAGLRGVGPDEAELRRAAALKRGRPFRDADGFRAQVLVRTRNGDVAALHNGDGRVLWRARAGASPRSTVARWLDPHEGGRRAEAVLFDLETSEARVFDAYTGALLETIALPEDAHDVVALPEPASDSAERVDRFGYLVVSPNAVTIVPDRDDVRAVAAAADAVLVVSDVERGVVTGATVGRGTAVPAPLWRTRMSAPLATVAGPRGEDAVAGVARVTGEGQLLFRHLDPNVLLIAAELPTGSLEVRLLDAASGRVLHAAEHPDARAPVQVALAENWVVYSFRARGEPRVQYASVELFEAGVTPPNAFELAMGNVPKGAGRGTLPPVARSALFASRQDASALSTSRARRGVTTRLLLISTRGGQIQAFDRRALDPRRPRVAPGAKPTAAQQAEGLPPYSPELQGGMYVTYAVRVARLRGTASTGAELESASLVFAYGLDTYHARVAPAKTYDMVPADFPAGLLVLFVVAMAAGAGALAKLSTTRIVNKQWA